MYDSAEGKQFIMVMPNKEVLFNYICNGLYYNDLKNRDFVLVNTVEEKREIFSHREL